MKITMTLTDLTPEEAERIIDGLHGVGLGYPREQDDPGLSYERKKAIAEAQAADSEERRTGVSEVIVLKDTTDETYESSLPEADDMLGRTMTRQEEQAAFIAECDKKWKRTASIQVEGQTKKIGDEVVLKDTGEVAVLAVLWRGKAVVDLENGEQRFVEASHLKRTSEDTQNEALEPDEKAYSDRGENGDEAEDVISADDLRSLANEVVKVKGARFVMNLFTRHCGQPTKAIDVPPAKRDGVAEELRGSLT